MNLPEEFLKQMQSRRGLDYPAFLRSYEREEAYRALRVNPLKVRKEEFLPISPFELSPVSWEENGFYLSEKKAGADVYHFAGLYYCQEPSAMCAAPLLGVKEGERALDLCAAPGGKSGQLAAALNGTGILFCNEYVSSRAKILAENLERLGVKNAVVLNEDTAKLAKEFPEYFDKILVDAPCSGEGMFLKEPSAIGEWSMENVLRCALRQKEILQNAANMLAVGGKIVYSTCTFSQEENEDVIADFLQNNPEFTLLEQKLLLPHQIKGEGHFAALLQKTRGERRDFKRYSARKDAKAEKAIEAFFADFLADRTALRGEITTLSDGRVFLLPPEMPACSLRLLRAGLELGEWDGKVFKPAHALACSLKKEECKRFLSLSREESERYLRGETLNTEQENGWCVVGVENYSLGLGKIVNGVVKNHFPKGLRKVGG